MGFLPALLCVALLLDTIFVHSSERCVYSDEKPLCWFDQVFDKSDNVEIKNTNNVYVFLWRLCVEYRTILLWINVFLHAPELTLVHLCN